MPALNGLLAITAAGLLIIPRFGCAQTTVPSRAFDTLAAECAPGVHPTALRGVVSTESAGNPYAIGVVGGQLERQPRNLSEAVATAQELERQGFNFSMGLGQVNRYNLVKYGERYETVFEPCRNLKVGSAILKDCYHRARARISDDQQALRAAFSCYYSGNFTRGFQPARAGQRSYVQKVVANATGTAEPIFVVPAVKPDSAEPTVAAPQTGTALSVKRPARSAQWVTFADDSSQCDQTMRLATPTHSTAVDAHPIRCAPTSALHQTQPAPAQQSPSSIKQQTAPFVQFVN